MPYDSLIIDSFNLAHRLFYDSNQDKTLASVSKKLVYLSFIKRFMEYVDLLKERFGNPGCRIFILFDNPTSRSKLKHSATEYTSARIRYELDPEYKANRKKENKEFYNSIQFIKFLFSIKGPEYFTIRVPNLEADDLVKPVISEQCGEGMTLMVSTDMDWCRFLSPFVHILMGGVNEEVITPQGFRAKYNFLPTEEKIILYKILYGDPSDNIRPIFSEIPKAIRHDMMEYCKTVNDLYLNLPEQFSGYKEILENHRKDMRVAYQLLSVIPVEAGRLASYTVKGRVALRLQEMVNKIFTEYDEKKTPKKFSFGRLKTPRL